MTIFELKQNDSNSPDCVLEAAKGRLVSALIIGKTPDGGRYYASTTSWSPNMLWEVELFKQRLLRDGEME